MMDSAHVAETSQAILTVVDHALRASSLPLADNDRKQQIIPPGSDAKVSRTLNGRLQPRGPSAPVLAFLFTGQGSQYPDMGRQLYAQEAVFRQTLDRCAAILTKLLNGPSVLDVLFPVERDAHLIHETRYAQPCLFALEYSLAEMWRSRGVVPDVVLGHSVGEYVAACFAGVMSLEDGLELIVSRAILTFNCDPQHGVMVAVRTSEQEARKAMAVVQAGSVPAVSGRLHDLMSIAAINGPKSVMLSGREDAVLAVIAALPGSPGTKHATVSHAFHSPLLASMLPEFDSVLCKIEARGGLHAPSIPIVSNLQGRLCTDGSVATAAHWLAHVLGCVRRGHGVSRESRCDCVS